MVSQTTIKALNSVQTQLVKIPGLTEDQLEQIQAIIANHTQPKIKGTGKKTGYLLFSVEERKRLKNEGELDGLAFGDIAKLIGKNWRESEQSHRDDWNAQAKEINDSNAPAVQDVPAVKVEANPVQQPVKQPVKQSVKQPMQVASETEGSSTEIDEPVIEAKPKKRGRKTKAKSSDESNSEGEIKQPKRRGRKPKKQREEVVVSEESDSEF
jgi:hypothetical protein